MSTLLRDGCNAHGDRLELRIVGGCIAEVGHALPSRPDDVEVFDCAGGTVLPGLHDHHLHLLATAARGSSVLCGPPAVRDRRQLHQSLHEASPVGGWIRGIDYDESVAGLPDRAMLDELRADVPVRIQHRSGALWLLNTAALSAVGADEGPEGVERDATGRVTGRLWRVDGWLRTRLPTPPRPSLTELSQRLASYGIVGVTDATPDLDDDTLTLLADARRSGEFVQHLTVLGSDAPLQSAHYDVGPRKVVVADHDLPSLPDLIAMITVARAACGRPIAVHCVTREALLLTLAAIEFVGPVVGDRIEHAAIVPPELRPALRRLGLTVVTQPSLIASRGDDYLARVDVADRSGLWPLRTLLEAGVPVGCSSDAPYGDLDPWVSIKAAHSRAAPSGRQVNSAEAVDTATALLGFLTAADAPGGPARRVAVGAAADLVVLGAPVREVLRDPDRSCVRATFIAGYRAH